MANIESFNSDPGGVNSNEPGSFWHIFLEPSRCFKGLNKRPRFAIPLVLSILVVSATYFVLYSRIDMARVTRENIQLSSFADRLSEEQIDNQVKSVARYGKVMAMVSPVIKVPFYVLLISGLIVLGIFVTGDEISVGLNPSGDEARVRGMSSAPSGGGSAFSKVLAVTTASMFFYWVVKGVLSSAVVLAAADPDSINVANPVFTNPAGLVDSSESRIFYGFLSQIDVLVFYTIFLIGLGISKITVRGSMGRGVMIIGFWYVLYTLLQTGLSALSA